MASSLMKTRVVLFKLMNAGQMSERYFSANVGFIGLGNMGNSMAANLLKKVKNNKNYDRSLLY